MNTTEIGNKYEDAVYNLFSIELKEDRLPFNSETSKMFRKKKYYSKDREKDIIVDISIEGYIDGIDEWSTLIVLECKDYSNAVEVGEVEEFHTKISQIGGNNVKGIMVSTNSFQQGGITFAKNKGIGLVRTTSKEILKWYLPRAATGYVSYGMVSEKDLEIFRALSQEDYRNDHIDFFSYYDGVYTSSAYNFFELLIGSKLTTKKKNTVPYISKEAIERFSRKILTSINYNNYEVPINRIIDQLESKNLLKVYYENRLGYDIRGAKILGKLTFNPNEIRISNEAHDGDERRIKFTIAHELGHYYLKHHKYLSAEYHCQNDADQESVDKISIQEIQRMEWQANYFASTILLPSKQFVDLFLLLLSLSDVKDRGYGLLYVDSQADNLMSFYKITDVLKDKFKVSRKVVEVRLKGLNLLNDKR